MSALDTIRSMGTKDLEKLALRIAKELSFDVRGTRVTDDVVELDSYLRLATGETLHYLFLLVRKNIGRDFLDSLVTRVNNPFIRILVMSAGDVDEAAVKYADEKGIELSQWDQFLQFLEKYGILRELERKDEDTAYLPSLGEVQSMEAWARNFMEEGDYRKAMEYIDEGLKIKDTYEPLVRMKADAYRALGRNRDAEEWYRKATMLNESDAGAWTALAEILEERGDSDAALIALDRLTEIMPDSYRAWMEKGELLYRRGMYDEALLCFNRATKISPNGKEAWNNRGLVLKHLGRFEEAVDSFNRALSIDPVFWDALINKALLFHEKGMYAQAVDTYTYMLKIREDAAIYCQRGIAYSEWGMKKEAVDDLRKALELDPGLKACEEELRGLDVEEAVVEPVLEETEQVEETEEVEEVEPEPEAESELEAAEEDKEEIPLEDVAGLSAFVNAAQMKKLTDEDVHVEEETGSEPEEAMEEEVIEEPEEEEPVEEPEPEPEPIEEGKEKEMPNVLSGISSLSQLMNRGNLYFKLGMLEEALECYEALLEAKPRSKEILNASAVILYLLGMKEEALERLKKAVDIDPAFEDALLNMLQIHIDAGKMPRALDLLNSIIRKKRSPSLWVRRGKILERMGRDGASIQSYEKALEISDSMIRLWNARGISYHRIGEEEDALESFENGISVDERDAVLWSNYGAVHLLSGNMEDAAEAFDRGLSEDMDFAALHNNLGVLLAEKGDEVGARERFSMALERDESATYAYNNSKYL